MEKLENEKRQGRNGWIPQCLVLLCLLSLSGAEVSAQMDFARREKISQRLDSLFRAVANDTALHFNGVVLVADHGEPIYQHSQGYADIGRKIPNGLSTRFDLASLSGVFTCLAVMQLKDRGLVKLDDPLISYLPDFPYPGITIRQLLSHTSGLPAFREIFPMSAGSIPGKGLSNKDLIPALKKFGRLTSVPGTRWRDAGLEMGLLVLVVEKVSGLSFQQYVADFIDKPAGLQHTYIHTPLAPVADSSRAVFYSNPGKGFAFLSDFDSVRADPANPFQTIVGPGTVVSTAEDLLRFDQALYSDRLLSISAREEMFSPVKLIDGRPAVIPRVAAYAGLDWAIQEDTSGGKLVFCKGEIPGSTVLLLRNLLTHQTCILMENVDNSAGLYFGMNAMNILEDRPLRDFGDMPSPPIVVPAGPPIPPPGAGAVPGVPAPGPPSGPPPPGPPPIPSPVPPSGSPSGPPPVPAPAQSPLQ